MTKIHEDLSRQPSPQLLIGAGTAKVTEMKVPLVAMDCFKKLKISFLDENFKKWFLGKKESHFGGSTLQYWKLAAYSVDLRIIEELGGEEKVKTSLAELLFLMEKQSDGGKGALLANGNPNIFYVPDRDGTLRVVLASWYRGGWSIHANPIVDPYGWGSRSRVFTRTLP